MILRIYFRSRDHPGRQADHLDLLVRLAKIATSLGLQDHPDHRGPRGKMVTLDIYLHQKMKLK